jgi:hypothetical protein
MALQTERPPYTSYAAIMGTFSGGLAAAGALSRFLRRDPQCQTALDLVVLSAATFKAARTLSHDASGRGPRQRSRRRRSSPPGSDGF